MKIELHLNIYIKFDGFGQLDGFVGQLEIGHFTHFAAKILNNSNFLKKNFVEDIKFYLKIELYLNIYNKIDGFGQL